MQITNDSSLSALDLFGTDSVYANATEKEMRGTALLSRDGDSVTISGEARQLYAQQSAAAQENAATPAQGGTGGSGSDNSQIQNQIQSLRSQIASLMQVSGENNTGEIAALQAQLAALQAQLG